MTALHTSVSMASDIAENRSIRTFARDLRSRADPESLRRPTSFKFGETYTGAICLGPRIIAIDSLYFPLKTGWRFSKKALRASWASSLLKAMRILESS